MQYKYKVEIYLILCWDTFIYTYKMYIKQKFAWKQVFLETVIFYFSTWNTIALIAFK